MFHCLRIYLNLFIVISVSAILKLEVHKRIPQLQLAITAAEQIIILKMTQKYPEVKISFCEAVTLKLTFKVNFISKNEETGECGDTSKLLFIIIFGVWRIIYLFI